MRKVSLTRKYAKALTDSLSDEKEYVKVKNELERFSKFLKNNLKLKAGLETMLFSFSQKIEVLDIYGSEAVLDKKTYNFLRTLTENKRMLYLDDIVEIMEDFWFESRGIEKFILFSAVDIDGEQEERLRNKLKKALNKDVVFEKRVDPSILAGIKLMRGSIYYDFSVEGNLKKLRESLIGEDSI